jgi:acetaldehyde dehydrogenase (acetylating)
VLGAGPAVDRHGLLAGRVGQPVGVGDEVEEVVGVHVRHDDGIDVDVVAEAAQLGEHAVAAVQQQAGVLLLDEVPAARSPGVLPRG